MFPTTHSRMTLRSEQWMAQGKNEQEGEVWGVGVRMGTGQGDRPGHREAAHLRKTRARRQSGDISPGQEASPRI